MFSWSGHVGSRVLAAVRVFDGAVSEGARARSCARCAADHFFRGVVEDAREQLAVFLVGVSTEARVAVLREAAGCGVALETVDVTMDAKLGMLAHVRTRASALPLRSALGRYTFAAEFTEG